MDHTSSRKLVAILFADIAGYTAMMQKDEEKGMQVLNRFQDVLEVTLPKYGGETIKNYGDSSICIFSSTTGAVKCAKELQEIFRGDIKVPLRIGLHEGDVILKDGDVYGDAINIASRIESMGIPGNILVSKSLYNKVKNQQGLEFTSLGKFNCKNIDDSLEVYALSNDGFPVPKRRNLEGKFKDPRSKFSNWSKILFPIILLGVMFIYYQQSIREDDNDSEDPFTYQNSIAVLPFKDLSLGSKVDFLGEGIAANIISLLSKVPKLKVIGSNSSFLLADQALDNIKIADTLDVEYILEGNLVNENDILILNVNLVDGKNGEIVWSRSVQDSIQKFSRSNLSLVSRLCNEMKVSVEEASLQSNVESSRIETYLLYAKANYLWSMDYNNRPILINSMDKCLEIDSNYLPCLSLDCIFSYDSTEMEAIVQKMNNIDSTSVHSIWTTAYFHYFLHKDLESGYRLLDKLLKEKNLSVLHYSSAAYNIGFFDVNTGLMHLKRALDIDPLHVWNYHNLFTLSMFNSEYEKALEYLDIFDQISDNKQMINWYFSIIYNALGQHDKAMTYIDKLPKESYESHTSYLDKAYTLYKQGKIDEGNKMRRKILDLDSTGFVSVFPTFFAACEVAKGNKDEAFKYLNTALKVKGVHLYNAFYITWAKYHPYLRPLHDDPRWDQFLKDAGFPETDGY